MNGSEFKKMQSGEIYDPNAPELIEMRERAQRFLKSYNQTTSADAIIREPLLTNTLGKVGENCEIRSPFYLEYGPNIHFGQTVFVNFNCMFLDVCRIEIGDRTQIGPGVQFYTADHPRNTAERAKGIEFGRPISIGSDVWIGGHAVILPGITIGDGAIIGAGAVVTKDVPSEARAVGNPARLLIL